MKNTFLYTLILTLFLMGCEEEIANLRGNEPGHHNYIPVEFKTLVFGDEFEGDGLPDAQKWGFEIGFVRNSELQYYTNGRLENCYQKDGNLHIVARNDNALIDGETRPFTSASITTRAKAGWKYCRVEVRAKLPVARGTWPAIWMLPVSTAIYGGWPKSGEIDIMENVGYDATKMHFTAHMEKYNYTKNNAKAATLTTTTPGDFHVYALEWQRDRLIWYFDGEPVHEYKTELNSTWQSWPFNQHFYLIINLAFGGGWGGQQGVDLSKLPLDYVIDYVRVYQ
ncbi:glycoside hydrolase family 16 protein [Desertivirga xinjiangensis]|uniref:glycoside hydrolase family 16 protein n=1 Tax=Desertivirga xinjiangensis TaxID=539206 RepID=UPI0021096E98|nr:glycoside hydrolase family 16 protein [Pedobacter xinjiangensis]